MLAIDAANRSLIQQWAAEGILPNIQSLISAGLVGETSSVDGFFVGSTWPSFYTGTTPARHGLHSHLQLKPGTYDFVYWKSKPELTRKEPFWNHLSRAGRRVAILDVPLTTVSTGLRGIQSVEWGCHDAIYGFRTWPVGLAATIRSRFGMHQLGPCCDADSRSLQDFQSLVDRLVRGARRKGELTRYLLAQGGWDFFMQVFSESHCAGHQCWHLQDPQHPAFDPEASSKIGNPLRDVYSAIDAAIGDILQEVDGDARVVLLIAHGMSHWYGAQFLLREILYRLQAAFPKTPPPIRSGILPPPSDLLARCWRGLPVPVRSSLKPVAKTMRGWLEKEPPLPALHADPARSRCFLVDNGHLVGGIRLNLIGREPQGLLQPGAEADSFCSELARDLLQIVDERTGTQVIRRVRRTAELYRGECLEELPDLLVEWNDELPRGSVVVGAGSAATVRLSSPKIGILEGVNDYNRTGDHRIGGMFVATGPGITPGRLERTTSIMDFAPTFTQLLGVDFNQYDGQAISELVESAAAYVDAQAQR